MGTRLVRLMRLGAGVKAQRTQALPRAAEKAVRAEQQPPADCLPRP